VVNDVATSQIIWTPQQQQQMINGAPYEVSHNRPPPHTDATQGGERN
jgi:hypothetical protein